MRTVTLRLEGVRDDFADALQPGMEERVGGSTVARVTDVHVEPSLIIATGDNGTVNVGSPYRPRGDADHGVADSRDCLGAAFQR